MLSDHAYHKMDRLAIRNNRENERRLLEELERISSDKHRAPMLTHPVFTPESFTFDSSPIMSSLDASHHDALRLDFDQPQSPPPYPNFDTEEQPCVHVDHTGKLSHFPTSAWLASTISSLPPSATVSSTSSTLDRAATPLNACVAAAAATAAMIVVPDNTNCKRPRSPSPLSLQYDQSPHHHTTDHSIHSESELTDDPISPRAVQHFGNSESSPIFKTSCPSEHTHTAKTKATAKPPNEHRTNSVKTYSSDTTKKAPPTFSTTPATDAEMSRKRRAEAMERFRRKKAVRCYARRVRYQVRKRIATTRPRVNGRFARRIDAINHAAKHAK